MLDTAPTFLVFVPSKIILSLKKKTKRFIKSFFKKWVLLKYVPLLTGLWIEMDQQGSTFMNIKI